MDSGTLLIAAAVEYSIKLVILCVVLVVRHKQQQEKERMWAMNRMNLQHQQQQHEQSYQSYGSGSHSTGQQVTGPHVISVIPSSSTAPTGYYPEAVPAPPPPYSPSATKY